MRRVDSMLPSGTRPVLRLETALIAFAYIGYSLTRVTVDPDAATALGHGRQLLAWEASLGIDVETAVVQWLVASPTLSVMASYLYATLHYVVTPAVLGWLYWVHPTRYRSARLVLLLATAAALVVYWLVPTAPPRLLEGRFPDVLARTSEWGWWGEAASAPAGLGSFTNQYAALPSMHVGWALWAGLVVALLARTRFIKVIALAYPGVMTGLVVATANHYVLDAVAGALVVGAAAAVVPVMGRRRWLPSLTGSRTAMRQLQAPHRQVSNVVPRCGAVRCRSPILTKTTWPTPNTGVGGAASSR